MWPADHCSIVSRHNYFKKIEEEEIIFILDILKTQDLTFNLPCHDDTLLENYDAFGLDMI